MSFLLLFSIIYLHSPAIITGGKTKVIWSLKKVKCFAILKIKQMDTKVTKYSPTLKYEFNPNEKPTVGQAINSLLPTNFGMPLAQAMAQFDLKVQIRERATESALVFVDFDQ
ncbi:hypothetical protein niasHS_009340 [Heterodera schachtii]|uniref:Uncharacterized protein n=1 Tax=Heterodera schachtii TaxID=97005 RepID=A0ABD2JBR4_HETSC